MIITFFTLFSLMILKVEASDMPPRLNESGLSISDFIQNETSKESCKLERTNNEPYLFAWQDIPQRAQGCSVPFYGPQGHGQFPEEVHIIHLTEVWRLDQAVTKQASEMILITIKLECAKANAKMRKMWDNNYSTSPLSPRKNHTNFLFDELKQNGTRDEEILDISAHKRVDNHSNGSLNASQIYELMRESRATHVNKDRPLVLLLFSDQPVKWHISTGGCGAHELTSNIQTVVDKESIVSSEYPIEVIPKTWLKKINRKNIQRFARRTYNGVASFTQIREANSIKIAPGTAGFSETDCKRYFTLRNRNKLNFCDFSSREESRIVSAFLSLPSSVESCIIGSKGPVRTYLVDLHPLEPNPITKDQTTIKMANGSISNEVIKPIILVYLFDSKLGETSDRVQRRNVYLVLRSHQPVLWSFQTSLHNTFVNVVLDENDQHDNMNANGMTLILWSMPRTESDLLHKVVNEMSAPIQVLRVEPVSRLTLDFSHVGLQESRVINTFHQHLSGLDIPSLPLFTSKELQPSHLDDSEKQKRITSILEINMRIFCGSSKLKIVLPASSLMQLGVKFLHLMDKSCQSYLNGSHFIIESPLESCGSSMHSSGKTSAFSNTVFVAFTTSSKEGPSEHFSEPGQAGTPVVCGLEKESDTQVVRTILNNYDDIKSNEDEGLLGGGLSKVDSSSIYQLEVYKIDPLSGRMTPIKYNNVIKNNERLFVRGWMDDAPSARAVLDTCWISNVDHSTTRFPDLKKVLLTGMCPIEETVKIETQLPSMFFSQNISFIFSFEVGQELSHLGPELYIHCKIGICLLSTKLFKGSTYECVDPKDYCSHWNPGLPSTKGVSTAHQLLIRGPILLPLPFLNSHTPHAPLKTQCSDVPKLPYPLTISMNMTAVIAVCSFIIGIGLTATIWVIHNKTEPTHAGYHIREHSLGSQSVVMGSSLSPHSACSSTNSQSIITS